MRLVKSFCLKTMCAVAAAAFVGVVGAQASLLSYDVNATYTDGALIDGTITGSFTVDYLGGTSAAVTAVSLTSSASGPVPAATYLPVNSGFTEYGGTTEFPTSDVWDFSSGAVINGDSYNGPVVVLAFIFPSGSILDTYGFGASQFWTRNNGGQTTFYSIAGTVTPAVVSATPLPATWTMLIAGFVGLGFFSYRGSKKAAAAIAVA